MKLEFPDQPGARRIQARIPKYGNGFQLRGTEPHDQHELVSASPYNNSAEQEHQENQYFPHGYRPSVARFYSPGSEEVNAKALVMLGGNSLPKL